MRIWQTDRHAQALALRPPVLAGLIAGITDPDPTALPRAMLDLVRSEVDLTNCAVFLLPADGTPSVLKRAERIDPGGAASASGAYASRFYRSDMAVQQVLRQRQAMAPDTTVLLHHDARDIADAAYRAECYEAVGTSQRFAVLRTLPGGRDSLLIGMYRAASGPGLSASDLRFLSMAADCLAEATVQRLRALPPPALLARDAVDALAQSRQAVLSRREREVVLAIAQGRTLPATAQAMGVRLSSVVTYRNRALDKLGLPSRGELLALLLAHARPGASPPG